MKPLIAKLIYNHRAAAWHQRGNARCVPDAWRYFTTLGMISTINHEILRQTRDINRARAYTQ